MRGALIASVGALRGPCIRHGWLLAKIRSTRWPTNRFLVGPCNRSGLQLILTIYFVASPANELREVCCIAELDRLAFVSKRWLYSVWIVLIGAFAVLHALNLAADFPNHTPWHIDWAKYTDEGWYGNAAVRAHLFGNWYAPGDFNPAPSVPVWPFLEWILFFFTGVNIEAARGLAVAFFFANLVLCYTLLRPRGPKWVALWRSR